MDQLWTIIIIVVLAAAFGVAAWHDRDDKKARERRESASERKDGRE
jgi:predicted outer membrane lipoprotein